MSSSEHGIHAGSFGRRKVRKGTVSCWECKRRKVRCTFDDGSPTAICNPCKARATECVSQRLPDVERTPQIGERLTRVERVLEEVLVRLDAGEQVCQPCREAARLDENDRDVNRGTGDAHQVQGQQMEAETVEFEPATRQSISSHAAQAGYATLSHALLSSLPSQHILKKILSEPVEAPKCLDGLLQSVSNSAGPLLTWESWKPPPPLETAPVLVAKSLLILICYLQSMPPDRILHLGHTGIDWRQINLQILNTVQDLVLTKDDLVHSVDGVECLLIESMYHNNAGDLKRAWLSARRALTIAQMIRLDRDRCAPCKRRLWFALVKQNRYLSLMLRLSDGTPDAHDLADIPDSSSVTERLERLDTLAAGRMLHRTVSDTRNIVLTAEIDSILQDAASSMPSRWWLIPNSFEKDDADYGDGTVRLMHQLAHFHLVARLYLPYLLHSSTQANHEQCKLTTVNASREILTRFVAFRTATASRLYCRGIDIIVFVACTTICLTHVQHTLQQKQTGGSHQFSCLAHQRSIDRGLMESALDILSTDPTNQDDTSRLTTIIVHLLKTEAEAAAGTAFVTRTSVDTEQECSGEYDADHHILRIYIAWIGTVTFERKAVGSAQSQACPDDAAEMYYMSIATMETDPNFEPEDDIWPLSDVDTVLFDDIFRGLNAPYGT